MRCAGSETDLQTLPCLLKLLGVTLFIFLYLEQLTITLLSMSKTVHVILSSAVYLLKSELLHINTLLFSHWNCLNILSYLIQY